MKRTVLLFLLFLAEIAVVLWLQPAPLRPYVAPRPPPAPLAPEPVYGSWGFTDESEGWFNRLTCYFAVEKDGKVLIYGTDRRGFMNRPSIAHWTISPEGELDLDCFEERGGAFGGTFNHPGPCGPDPGPPEQCSAKYLGVSNKIPFRSRIYIERRLRFAGVYP